MINRRNYVIIGVIMLIVLFLFQFSQVIKSQDTDYVVNPYADISLSPDKEWEQTKMSLDSELDFSDKEGDYILFVGDEKTDVGSIVSQWTRYSKRDILTVSKIEKFSKAALPNPEFVVVDSAYVDFSKDLSTLEGLTDKGISIVLCTLPELSEIEENEELRKFLGISYVKEENVNVEGIKLFEGFLLGGETIYEPQKPKEEKRQDMNLSMPWFVTAGGTKTYMVGILDEFYQDYEYKNDYFPAIIWRNSLGFGQVFCVNGDYMGTTSGLGILSAMINELSPFQIYPVVNAQNTLLVNFPLMSDENEEEFFEAYSRNVSAFQSEVIWPTLISLAEKYDLKYTSFISPKFDYQDPAQPTVESYLTYMQAFRERGTEMGLSLEHEEGVDLLDKLSFDKDFYDGIEQKYICTGAFINLSDIEVLPQALEKSYVRNVRTVACAEDVQIPILSYCAEGVTLQSLTSDTKNLTYSRDLRLKSIETALGFDNAELNFSDVVWPKAEGDYWEIIYNDMSSSLATYWKPFRKFDRTTLTESDERVRTFLNLNYGVVRNGDEIALTVTGRGNDTCYFLLRTHGEEIVDMTGGSFTKVEEDAYLLTIDSDEVSIYVQQKAAVK